MYFSKIKETKRYFIYIPRWPFQIRSRTYGSSTKSQGLNKPYQPWFWSCIYACQHHLLSETSHHLPLSTLPLNFVRIIWVRSQIVRNFSVFPDSTQALKPSCLSGQIKPGLIKFSNFWRTGKLWLKSVKYYVPWAINCFYNCRGHMIIPAMNFDTGDEICASTTISFL